MNFKKRFEGRTSIIGKTGIDNAILSVCFPVEKETAGIMHPENLHRPAIGCPPTIILYSPQSRSNRKHSISDVKLNFLTPPPSKLIQFPFVNKLAEYKVNSKSSSKKHCMLLKLLEKGHIKAVQSRTIDNCQNSSNMTSLPKIKI